MRIYSLRNLLICFAIILILVLWVAYYTFSNLQSQKQELIKIRQAREVLLVSGPAASNMQALESARANFIASGYKKIPGDYRDMLEKARNDSIKLTRLAELHPADAASFIRLTYLIHQMTGISLAAVNGQPAGIVAETGVNITGEFKAIINQLENKNRETLQNSYHYSMDLTRRAMTLVTIIVAVLALFFIVSFSLIYRDIKSRKKREDELKKFNAHLEQQVDEKTMLVREVFERVSDAFVALDTNWCYTYMNRTAGNIFGRDPQKMIGKHIWTEFPEGIGQPFHKAYEKAMATQQYVYLEEYYPPYDKWFENHIYPSSKGISIYFRDITDRKKIEQAARTNEEQLKLIYNSTTDIIFLLSVENQGNKHKYRFSSVNQAFLASTGLAKEQVVDKYVEEVIPEPSVFMVVDKYDQAIRTGRPVEWEETSKYPAGYKTGIVTVNPVFNDQGECTMLVGVVHDITSRKKAEQDLVIAEAKFRNLVEQALVGVYIIQDGRFAYVNPRFAEIFGYRQEELINTNPISVITQGYKLMVAENVRARVEGETDSIHYEATGLKKNGEEVQIEIFCGGKLYEKTTAIIGTLLDITERKKAEEEIVRANERFNLIAKATNDVVWDWDMINDRNRGNDIFYKYYGISPGDPSNNQTFLSRVHPEDKDRIVKKLQQTIEKKEEVILDEFRFRMPDGSWRYFYDRAYIIYNKQGNPVRMIGSMMDITEKILLEKEISDQKVQAQKTITRAVLKAEERERNKLGQELHDNVNQILVSAKLFLGSLPKTTDAERSRRLADDATKLIETAIQEIRLLSQNQVTPLMESDLEELIQLLIYNLNQSGTSKTSLVYNLNGQVIDPDLKLNIYRIIQEQINNIMKHAAASEINISLNADAEFVYVSIVDNGRGFDTARSRGGIGISNMINRVESFNGEMIIESSPGTGCRIDVKIPVGRDF